MAKRVDVKSPMLFTSAECERVSSEWITGGLRGFADGRACMYAGGLPSEELYESSRAGQAPDSLRRLRALRARRCSRVNVKLARGYVVLEGPSSASCWMFARFDE